MLSRSRNLRAGFRCSDLCQSGFRAEADGVYMKAEQVTLPVLSFATVQPLLGQGARELQICATRI